LFALAGLATRGIGLTHALYTQRLGGLIAGILTFATGPITTITTALLANAVAGAITLTFNAVDAFRTTPTLATTAIGATSLAVTLRRAIAFLLRGAINTRATSTALPATTIVTAIFALATWNTIYAALLSVARLSGTAGIQ